jgi:hypothetical protein
MAWPDIRAVKLRFDRLMAERDQLIQQKRRIPTTMYFESDLLLFFIISQPSPTVTADQLIRRLLRSYHEDSLDCAGSTA